jgi:hypothetical protein
MYKRFDFEGDVHQTLECVPLTVRRKLDIASLKISLEGWQALTRAERLALCHLPVDSEEDREVYIEVMRTFCERAGVPLKPLVDADAAGRTWNASTTPPRVKERADELHAKLDDATWRRLDEESRYALVKLSDPKRNPLKIHAALVELGLLAGPAPRVIPEVAVCAAPTP